MSTPKKLPAAALAVSSAIFCWIGACSDNSSTPGPDGGGSSSGSSGGGSGSGGSSSGSSGGAASDGPPGDGRPNDAAAEAGGLGLLVDDMTSTTGTRLALQVPPGQTPGSYYAYSDYPTPNDQGMSSRVIGTAQLADVPVSPPITNPDGSQIVGEICFHGTVVSYAGLGMSLAYGSPPDATPESGISSPVPFDASHYSGVSFYILVDPEDGPAPLIRFGIPDTQTADPAAWPAATCHVVDGGVCDDDFGSNVTFAPGQWTKVSFKWGDLGTVGFGFPPFTAINPSQLIGMKWQANGAGLEASVESFGFCISDIYFTP